MRQLNEIFAANLARLRQQAGLSQKGLSTRAAVGPRTVTRLESPDANPRLDSVDALASVLRVKPWKLLVPDEEALAAGPAPGYVRFELIDASPSAGPGAIADEFPDVVQRVDVLESWAKQMIGSADPERIKLLCVRGDSMAGKIEDGDIVFVDVSRRHFDGDGIYVMHWQGRFIVKRLRLLRDQRLAIESENRSHEPEYVHADEEDQLFIVGRVAGWWGYRRA